MNNHGMISQIQDLNAIMEESIHYLLNVIVCPGQLYKTTEENYCPLVKPCEFHILN